MHPEQWSRVESIFHNALRIPLTERDLFVRSEAGGDQYLYAEVISLLRSHEAESLLDHGAASVAASWLLAASPELQAGKCIGPYKISGEIGRGGMGAVYRAKDTRLDRDVALKFVWEAGIGSSERFQHFDREVRTSSALNHPNIITIHDIGSADGVPYVACEFVDGVTLRERLAAGRMDIDEVISVGLQVAEGLAVAHSAGIVHRDIKPENIMIRRDGLVKVLDFGVATLTTAGPAVVGACVSGTPRYMSPEQLVGGPTDARSDIYSLGLVLYEMATGRRPSSAMTLAQLPSDLYDVISRSVAADPGERYVSGGEMKAALEKVASGRPYSGPYQRSRKFVLSALAALVATGIGFTLWIANSEKTDDSPVGAVPLTGNRGYERFPSFSPEGTRVAFSWEQTGKHTPNIYVKVIGPGEPVQLTKDPAGDFGPAWSPDGRRIGFLRARGPSRAMIMLIPATGGQERELTGIDFDVEGILDRHFWIEDVPPPFFAWSPDCRWLLSLESAPGNSNSIVRVAVETGEKRVLISPASNHGRHGGLSMSPDGKLLAFTRTLGLSASDIYLLSLTKDVVARGEPTRLTFEGKEIDGLAWTADARNLVFSSARGGRRELWEMRPSPTSKPVRLTAAGNEPRDVAIASKGRHLVHSHFYLDWNIWRVPLKDKTAGQAINFISSTRIQEEPKYSPDGKRIAFESSRSGHEEIWICNEDGSSPIQLTAFGSAWAGSPRWSPDGQKIAFDCDAAGNIDVYVISSNGGKPIRLTRSGADDFRPSWSHDGKWIYFCSNRTGRAEIWKIPVTGGAEVQVTRNGGFVAFESADGENLYYTKDHTLWKLPTRGGSEIRITQSLCHHNFAPTKHGVYFIEDSSSAVNADLKFLDFRTRSLRTITTVPGPVGEEMSISPDERWMLYGKTDREGSELMLLENFQ
jgi:eukaryotic-like serine/threonine-protein kinase